MSDGIVPQPESAAPVESQPLEVDFSDFADKASDGPSCGAPVSEMLTNGDKVAEVDSERPRDYLKAGEAKAQAEIDSATLASREHLKNYLESQSPQLHVVTASKIRPRRINWLW